METRAKKEARQGRRGRDTRDAKTDGQFAVSKVSDPVASSDVMRLRSRDVRRILPTRPRTPESTPEQEDDELSQLKDREIALIGEMGGVNEALGYAAEGEESPVINTTEEEQVDKAIIKGALQMDKEKENTQRKKDHVYESPSRASTLPGPLALPLITLDSDDEPSIKIPGLATKTDLMSELKSTTGGTENLYLNLTPSETEEASKEAEGLGTNANHSQAAALLAELEELQQKVKVMDVGIAPPKLDLAAKSGEDNILSPHPVDPERPLGHEAATATATPIPEARTHVMGVEKQETASTGGQTNPGITNLKTDGGARPKALGDPLIPLRVRPQFNFYLPGGKRVSQSIAYKMNDQTPQGNDALMIRLPKLQEKYGQEMYMLDQQTGDLYLQHGLTGGFELVVERGHLHPTESIWAEMDEVSRKEYLKENDLNHELTRNNDANQSKVTSTPLVQPNISEKKPGEEKIKGLGEGDGLSPIKKEADIPRKPPRLEETQKPRPNPTPRTKINKVKDEGKDRVEDIESPPASVATKIKEMMESEITSLKAPKTPISSAPLNIDPAVLNRRRSEMIAKLPRDVHIPVATGTSPLQLIEDEEYYLRKLREVQEAKIKIVSLRRQHHLMGYGPEITEYIGPIFEEKQKRLEEQEAVIKKVVTKIHQLKDKWCYPIIFPLRANPPGVTIEEQKEYYENERIVCETLRQATSEIYQRRIKTRHDVQEQSEEVNRWKQWIDEITLKENEIAKKIEEMRRDNAQWNEQVTNLEPKDITIDNTLPPTPAQRVLHENNYRKHTVPGIVYSREVSRTSSVSRPTDDEARQSQEEAIDLCKKICSVTEDEDAYSSVRAREQKNKKNLINSREFVESMGKRPEKTTPRSQDDRNNRRKMRNFIAPSEEALRIMLERQTEVLAADREETLQRFISAVQQGMQEYRRTQENSRTPRRRPRSEQRSLGVEEDEKITEVPPPPFVPPQGHKYKNPIYEVEQKFGEEVTPVADQTQSTKTYLLDETKEEPTPVRVDYDPKNPEGRDNISFPIIPQPRQMRYEGTEGNVSETDMKRTYKKGDRERENNYPGNTTHEGTQSVPLVAHAGGSDPPGPGGGPGKGPPGDGSGGDRGHHRRRGGDGRRDPGDDPEDDPSDPSDETPEDDNHRRRRKIKRRIYLVQGPQGPPGKDGKDGRNNISPADGDNKTGAADPKLATALDDLAKALAKFGDGMTGMVNKQASFNKHLEKQITNQNQHLTTQEETMNEMLIASKRAIYNEAFAAIPVFEGTSRAEFEDWLESIEILCEISGRDKRTEILNRGGIVVKRVIRSIPPETPWEEQKAELRREFSVLQSKAHAAKILEELKQKPGETMRPYIQKYKMLHNNITGREADVETDASHIIRFLSSLQNVSIKRKISERGIPDGMTLGQVFTKAMTMEAGLQCSDRVVDDSAIGQVLTIEKGQVDALEDQRQPPRGRANPITCWTCGEHGHFQRECPLLKHQDGDNRKDGDGGTSTMYHTIFGRNEIPNKFLSQIYRQLAAETFKKRVYKAGLAQAAKAAIPTTSTAGKYATNQQVSQPHFTLTTDPTLTTNTNPKSSTADPKPIRIPRGVTDAKEFIKNLADRARNPRGRGGRSDRGRGDGSNRGRGVGRTINHIDVMEKLAEISDEEAGEENELTEEEIQELQDIIETLPPGHDILEDLNSDGSA